MEPNPLPELPKEDPYYTHCRKTLGELLAKEDEIKREQEQQARDKAAAPIIASSAREAPTVAVVLAALGFVVVALLMLAQTNDWSTIVAGGVIGAIAGTILGEILHFINKHKVLILVAGMIGYLYVSDHLGVLGMG